MTEKPPSKSRKKAAPQKDAPEKGAAADTAAAQPKAVPRRGWRRGVFWFKRVTQAVLGFFAVLILLYSFVPVPTNLYILSESIRLGGVEKDWVSFDDIAPDVARAAVAAEDANFCLHWGFDMAAIREAINEGSNRGASTITQQMVKNVFLWHDRNWVRKAAEALLTPVIELVWSKRRILEVYLNVAEFDEGVFGVEAAAKHHFGVSARDLSPTQAARLAAVLPDPKGRSASEPSSFVRRRTKQIISGADTILADGRAACFQE